MTGVGVHRFAITAAAATFLLLLWGGLVTSLEAGMVFSDWPLSEGSLNPDGWTRDRDMLAEHGHRILGALVGILTVSLAVWLQRGRERRSLVRVLGWCAVAAVCLQGLLGGLRVTEISTGLALVHGCTGQAYFCLMVSLAYLTSKDARVRPDEYGRDTTGLFVCGLAAVLAVSCQIVLGAHLRHVGGPIFFHLLGGLMSAGTVLWLFTLTLLRHSALRLPVLLLAVLTVVQLGLGWATAGAVRGLARHDHSLVRVALPTAHQSTGALMLALSVIATLRAYRRRRPLGVARLEAAA